MLDAYKKANDAVTAPEAAIHRAVDGPQVKKRPPKLVYRAAVAALLVVCIALGAVLWPGQSARALREVRYPQTVKLPDLMDYVGEDGTLDDEGYSAAYEQWAEAVTEQMSHVSELPEGFDDFTWRLCSALFSEGENSLCSPVSVYMALAMLAEVTGGESRQELLALLGEEGIDSLRSSADAVWYTSYTDSGASKVIPAASVWLDNEYGYKDSALDALAALYRASVYEGEMGSEALNGLLQDWLNEQTGGVLGDAVEGQRLSEQTALALVSTLYLEAKWEIEFMADDNEEGIFHSNGAELDCTFMCSSGLYNAVVAEGYSAVCLGFTSGGCMWFLLPDEGVSPEELLGEGLLDELSEASMRRVELWLPKFDLSYSGDLAETLKGMGLSEVFKAGEADFTPLTDGELYLSEVSHTARVKIDEKGCTAAAFTFMGAMGTAAEPEKPLELRFDRPFLFIVQGSNGLPLFTGTVYRP